MNLDEYKALGGRNKFNAKRCELDGVRFDSTSEKDFYVRLKADPEVLHIDVHVPVTLQGGVRYKLDFLVWRKSMCLDHKIIDSCYPAPSAVECKGYVSEGFRIKRRLFDQFHPLKPLLVVQKVGNKWKVL